MCISSRWRDLCECYEKAGGPEIFHVNSGIVSCVDGARFSTMLQTRCMRVCCVGGIFVYGQSHMEGSSGGGCRVDCEG